ncbi:MAG: hypothetical protein J1E63_00470, partial [Muribaculaceae bacterium]|nr:hypothetical protein [Muribaculaceae bacterium]
RGRRSPPRIVPEGQSLARPNLSDVGKRLDVKSRPFGTIFTVGCFPAQLAALACTGLLKEVPLRGTMLATTPVIRGRDFVSSHKTNIIS